MKRCLCFNYKKVSKELFAYLSTTGFNFPHIVDVNWRLSFHMKKLICYVEVY